MLRKLRWALLLAFPPAVAPSPPDPHALIDAAIAAMGGRNLVAGLNSFRLTGIQHEYALGNAERAEGPWRVQYTRFSELWDVTQDRLRRTAFNAAAVPGTPGAIEQVHILTDSVMSAVIGPRIAPGYGGFYEDYRDRTNGSPSRVLLAAAASPSLKWEKMVTRFGVPHDVVSFNTPSGPIRIELDRDSHLPTAVDIVRHPVLEIRRTIFGDVTTRAELVNWTVQANGLWWPMQQRFLFNGELFRDLSISRIDQNAVVASDSFAVADSTRAAYMKGVRSSGAWFKFGDRPEPPQPGGDIVRIADNWAMTLVKQDDGVVVFEAHLSEQYIKQVVAEVSRRWPGSRIKAFVLTSDPWAHLGGVRAVVAMGLPIYVNTGSIPFLTALSKMPFTLAPDDLAKAPKPPKFIGVSAKTVIGTGKKRIELYPVRGAYAERMTMAYFPERRMLYGADLVFPDRAPPGSPPLKTFLATPAIDLRRAVARERLQVDSLFCVQPGYPIFAWADFIPTGAQP